MNPGARTPPLTYPNRLNVRSGSDVGPPPNLVEDPELRFTPSGQPVAKFRVASTPRYFDKAANEWKDGDSLFLTCTVWRQAAENVAESLQRGMRIIVTGRLKQRSYETKERREAHRLRARGR
jgi:single stranded DNA-binding protein